MPDDNDIVRFRCQAVILAAFTLLVAVSAGAMWKWDTVADVTAVVGTIAGVVGMVVGTYIGIEMGGADLARAERARRDAEDARARAELRALRLAGSTDPQRAEFLLSRQDV